MTTIVFSTEERLADIHSTGYWRVLIHPAVFEMERITTLKDCWRIVEESRVSLRGWDYPHVEPAQRKLGDDWVQSGAAWANHVELWRFYQSGQFVHHFSVPEDREPPPLFWRDRGPTPIVSDPRVLDFLRVLYTFTEILQFARGLAYRSVLEPSARLRVELHGMEGRRLVAPPDRLFDRVYVCDTDTICWDRSIVPLALLADASSIALEATIHVFERFGWDDPSRRMLEEDQRRLLERRL